MLENTVDVATAEGFRAALTMNFLLKPYEAAYRIEMEAFTAHLSDPSVKIPGIEYRLAAQRMADAAATSLQTGQPVRLDS